MLITGGCGFIGCNLAAHYLDCGWEVILYDNFSRPGVDKNAEWLLASGDPRLAILRQDVRDSEALRAAMEGIDVVIHLAAQVAVTTSIIDPLEDFQVNALGGIHVLEAARLGGSDPIVFYASTNKVYGPLDQLRIEGQTLRYALSDHAEGIPETFPVDLHSPYGCSKGTCDLYALDYARVYGLRTVVFRQSCVYGPHQFGVEDQGWVAHFMISALLGRPITIYGDGRQVRDVLHIQDLIRVYDKAMERIEVARGQAYNIGGGAINALSLLEMIYRLEAVLDRPIPLRFAPWRIADQRVYISDIRKAQRDLGWCPEIPLDEGLSRLHVWVEENREFFEREWGAQRYAVGQSIAPAA
ncbi:MAG: GDP-mannose 4,6-dehydratase [Chloroflexota bacterium]